MHDELDLLVDSYYCVINWESTALWDSSTHLPLDFSRGRRDHVWLDYADKRSKAFKCNAWKSVGKNTISRLLKSLPHFAWRSVRNNVPIEQYSFVTCCVIPSFNKTCFYFQWYSCPPCMHIFNISILLGGSSPAPKLSCVHRISVTVTQQRVVGGTVRRPWFAAASASASMSAPAERHWPALSPCCDRSSRGSIPPASGRTGCRRGTWSRLTSRLCGKVGVCPEATLLASVSRVAKDHVDWWKQAAPGQQLHRPSVEKRSRTNAGFKTRKKEKKTNK